MALLFVVNVVWCLSDHLTFPVTQVCPVCDASYDVAMQQPFEYHVASHFRDEDDQQQQSQSDDQVWSLISFSHLLWKTFTILHKLPRKQIWRLQLDWRRIFQAYFS